ncbi:hypothetical protein BgiMline_016973, partial [Biomphalaria glabrata]
MATTSNSIGLGSLLKCSDEKISVAVRFSSNQSYIANVGIKDTILDLKKAVALEANISPRNINLVLAGQLLTDSTLIQ